MVGIYKITNKVNGKAYVGQSINITNRWKQHISKTGSTINPMYLDFKKYGIKNFTFEVLEECSKEELDKREDYYIQLYDTFNNGYNLTCSGHRPNQKIYKVHKPNYEEEGIDFVTFGIDEVRYAARNLTHSGLKFYLYLVENKDNDDFWLNPKDVMSKCNMSRSTYDRAKAELKQKGYLVMGKDNNIYFYDDCESGKKEKDRLYKQPSLSSLF